MKKVEVAVVSEKGQVVIPQEIRERLKISAGTRFAVYGRGDLVIFKKLELPAIKDVFGSWRDIKGSSANWVRKLRKESEWRLKRLKW